MTAAQQDPRDAQLLGLLDARHAAEDRARKAEHLLLVVALRLDLVGLGGPYDRETVARAVETWIEAGR